MTDTARLLIVDDEPDVRLLLETVLASEHNVALATDGQDALRQLESAAEPFDLLVCDLGMPHMTGDELVRHLQGDPRFSALPVLLLTGNETDQARLGMLEAGVADYVVKPVQPKELRVRVRNILHDSALLREVREARRETEAANRELREVNAELDRFAAAAAHDLQAPLSNISGYAQLLSRGTVGDPDKQAMLLSSIAENADRAIVLVRDLLAHARTVASADEVDAVDLEVMVNAVCHHLESAIDDSQAHVMTDGPLALVRARRVAVESLLLNLLSNAIRYRHPDRTPIVEVSTMPAATPDFVEVLVRDNGRGLDPELRERVFGLGTRGHDDDEQEGTGIGLATVRAVVSRHGGRIWLEDSPPPGGLTVHFTLPAA